MSEQTVEQTPEDREAQVQEQEQAQLDDGQLKVNPFNDAEVAHQRWVETGQTEPSSLIPEPKDEDEESGEEDDEA